MAMRPGRRETGKGIRGGTREHLDAFARFIWKDQVIFPGLLFASALCASYRQGAESGSFTDALAPSTQLDSMAASLFRRGTNTGLASSVEEREPSLGKKGE